MPVTKWLPRGRRDLQQRHRLLFWNLPSGPQWRCQLQGPARLQDHLRAMRDGQGLLFGGVRRRRTLPGRGWMFPQRRTLPVQRRLLFGHLPHGSRGRSSLRGRARLHGHRGNVQEIHRVLRRRGRVQRRQPLPGGRRVPKRSAALLPGHGLLLGRVYAQPHGQAGLPRFLRPRRRPVHGRGGLLRGKLRRFPRALFACPLTLVLLVPRNVPCPLCQLIPSTRKARRVRGLWRKIASSCPRSIPSPPPRLLARPPTRSAQKPAARCRQRPACFVGAQRMSRGPRSSAGPSYS